MIPNNLVQPLFQLIGAAGLIFIILGQLVKKKKKERQLMLIGGILLEAYSLYIGDIIFISLQAIFIIVIVYKLIK